MKMLPSLRAHTLAFSAACFALFYALAAQAASESSQIIAAINFEYVLQHSYAAKDLQKQIEASQSKHQQEAEKEAATLEAREKELAKKRDTLSAQAFDQQVMGFQKEVEQFQRKEQDYNAKLAAASNQAFSKIHGIIVEIVAAMSKEKGYLAVLSQTDTVYVHPSIDITEQVVAALNKKIQTLELHIKK